MCGHTSSLIFLNNVFLNRKCTKKADNNGLMTPEQRHRNMAAIRSKNTKPELIVRRWLWAHGYRYRLNLPRLPGHPDLVLRKYRTCIFVNGCFWHGHGVSADDQGRLSSNSRCCKLPTTNSDFWTRKIKRNMERDREEQQQLAAMGWHCIVIWECNLVTAQREQTLQSLAFTLNKIFLDDHSIKRPYATIEEEQPGWSIAAEDAS